MCVWAESGIIELMFVYGRGIEMIGQLRYRKRDCHSLLRLVNLSCQFTGEVGKELVASHRRLIRSKKV